MQDSEQIFAFLECPSYFAFGNIFTMESNTFASPYNREAKSQFCIPKPE